MEINQIMKKKNKILLSELEKVWNEKFNEKLMNVLTINQYYLDNEFLVKLHPNEVRGIIHINRNGQGFIDKEEKSYYIKKGNINTALNGDEVIIRKLRSEADDEAEVIKILKRNTQEITGVLHKNRIQFLSDNTKIQNKIEVINADKFIKEDGTPIDNNDKIVVKIVEYGKKLKVEIIKVIGKKSDPGIEILSILANYGIENEFNEAVKEQLKTIEEPTKVENRRDLRDLLTITIDGEDAKDLDDAISLIKKDGMYRLFVHIADVSYYVSENSAIDEEACQRGTSVYVVDRVVPMLPKQLSNGVCSLHPNVDRYTITCEILFDKQGEIIEYDIYPSIIHSNYRMSYNVVNEMIDGNLAYREKYAEILPLCMQALQLSQKIEVLKRKAGTIDFMTKEAKFELDTKGKVKKISVYERNKIHKLIEHFMVSANECVAEFLSMQKIPALYRVHTSPEEKKIREFLRFIKLFGIKYTGTISDLQPYDFQQILNNIKDAKTKEIVSHVLLRTMQKAYYDPECLGHFGLSLDYYTHFTSPIRRYPDLIVHRALRYFLFEQDYSKLFTFRDKLSTIAQQASEKERSAVEAEREVEALKKCEYMKYRIGKTYKGVISGIRKFGLFIELPNTVEGLVSAKSFKRRVIYNEVTQTLTVGKKVYSLGENVVVRVKAVDIYTKTIDFELVEKGKKSEKNNSTKSKSKA